MTAPLLPLDDRVAERLARSPLILLLDVDGTLAPIVERPELAAVPPETQRAVAALAAIEGVTVSLVSGRAAADARRMVGVGNVWAVGNHGAETIGPDGDVLVDPLVAPHEQGMTRTARALDQLLEPVHGVIVEDKRWTLSIHYRLADPEVVPRVRATVERVATEAGLVVHEGKKVLEVRPPVRVDKGTAVLALARRLGGEDGGVLFAGDDRTDEDAFRALRSQLPEAITVRIAPSEELPTVAAWALADPDEMRRFLELIPGVRAAALR